MSSSITELGNNDIVHAGLVKWDDNTPADTALEVTETQLSHRGKVVIPSG